MTPANIQRLQERIKGSPLWNSKSRENGDFYQQLTCPDCGRDSAWAYKENPLAVICNHKNKCGCITKTLSLFPDILKNIENEFGPTGADPNRPATEYCRLRGLNGSLEGVKYRYLGDTRHCGSGAVMFDVSGDVLNGRIFNPPKGEDKSHNVGGTRGLHW